MSIFQTRLLIEYFKFLFSSPNRLHQRIEIISRFKKIHKEVDCPHWEAELLHLADEILKIPTSLKGNIVECGVYKGCSTCKLSIVAKLTGRRLYACDSFSGLPEPKEYDKRHIHYDGTVETFKQGDYLSTVEEVCANLNKYGEPDAVELVPGWFHESLPDLAKKERFVLIFIDVDLYDSVVCCIENMWHSLQRGCKFYSHEANHPLTVTAFSDEGFWKSRFGMLPPKLIGAREGLSKAKPTLCYVQKS